MEFAKSALLVKVDFLENMIFGLRQKVLITITKGKYHRMKLMKTLNSNISKTTQNKLLKC